MLLVWSVIWNGEWVGSSDGERELRMNCALQNQGFVGNSTDSNVTGMQEIKWFFDSSKKWLVWCNLTCAKVTRKYDQKQKNI